MRRTWVLVLTLAFVAAACTPATTTPTGTGAAPQKTADFKQSKLDLAYSFFSDNSVHLPTSKALLVAALDSMKKEAKGAGGTDDVATPAFTDKAEFSLPDFKLFAAAAGTLAAKNPQVPAERFFRAGLLGLMSADPDCHTYYLDGRGGVIQSRPESSGGTGPQIPSGGTAIQAQPDQAGLQAKMLDGGVAYVTWHQFLVTGTYNIKDSVKAVLDKAVAAGAKAFLFDLRANIGGNGDDIMAAWFLNSGDGMVKVAVRTGNAGTKSAAQGVRLPAAYQLPIAIILNSRSGSAPEVFSLGLQENKRATIVGSKSAGCLGATSSVPLGDGSELYVVQQEFVGALTGARYNNAGIPPDVPADDPSAVATASKLLLDRIAGR
jgi:hypothetical protein